MKRCLVIAFSFLVSCSSHDHKQNLTEATSQSNGSDCPPMVKFLVPDNSSMTATNASRDIYPQQQFIFASGLPEPAMNNKWKKEHSIEEAITLYKTYLKANASHMYINVFRQFASYDILTQLGLLQEKNATEELYFFTNELAESKYEGGCLIYACLVKLKEQGYDQHKITACKEKFMHYLAGVQPPADTTVIITPSKQIPYRQQALKKRNIEIKKANQKFIALIAAS